MPGTNLPYSTGTGFGLDVDYGSYGTRGASNVSGAGGASGSTNPSDFYKEMAAQQLQSTIIDEIQSKAQSNAQTVIDSAKRRARSDAEYRINRGEQNGTGYGTSYWTDGINSHGFTGCIRANGRCSFSNGRVGNPTANTEITYNNVTLQAVMQKCAAEVEQLAKKLEEQNRYPC